MRPGEGRAGKVVAPAICRRVEDDDHVELMIVYAADDFHTRWKIPRRTDQNPHNAWSFNTWDEVHYQPNAPAEVEPEPDAHLTWADVREMHTEIMVMRGQ